MNFFDLHLGPSFLAALAIIAGAFVSEDAATITAATLAVASVLDVRVSFVSAVAGLWVGDLGVYGAVRWWRARAGKTRWFWQAADALKNEFMMARGDWPMAHRRFFPVTSLPDY